MSASAGSLSGGPVGSALASRRRWRAAVRGTLFAWLWCVGGAALRAAAAGDGEPRAEVYRNESPPRLSSSAKTLVLVPARGSQNVAMVGAKLYGKTIERRQTADAHYGTVNSRSALQFARVTLQSPRRPLKDVQVDVIVYLAEGDAVRELQESFDIGSLGPSDRIAIDTKGYIDVTGKEVRSSSTGTTTTHEKRIHYKAKVKGVVIKLYEGGDLVYAASSAPEELSRLETELKTDSAP